MEIKGRGSIGNQVTKYPIKTVRLKRPANQTLDAKKLWFDNKFGRLNTEEKGGTWVSLMQKTGYWWCIMMGIMRSPTRN
jgi:hypothetical protein